MSGRTCSGMFGPQRPALSRPCLTGINQSKYVLYYLDLHKRYCVIIMQMRCWMSIWAWTLYIIYHHLSLFIIFISRFNHADFHLGFDLVKVDLIELRWQHNILHGVEYWPKESNWRHVQACLIKYWRYYCWLPSRMFYFKVNKSCNNSILRLVNFKFVNVYSVVFSMRCFSAMPHLIQSNHISKLLLELFK